MQVFSVSVSKLIDEFRKLPGIGYKTASRLAFHIINMDEPAAKEFAQAIIEAKQNTKLCGECANLCEGERCDICSDGTRDKSTVCVVEHPKDIWLFEKTREYRGIYHILHGSISPSLGISADELKIKELIQRVSKGVVNEVIMATNPNLEGETTALYISKLLLPFDVKVTRIAYGLPVGGDLEYADEITLLKALEGRREMR